MSEMPNKQVTELSLAITNAMDNLPILSRLEFVKNIILLRGGRGSDVDHDTALVLADEILVGVIDVLKAHPSAANLRVPEI